MVLSKKLAKSEKKKEKEKVNSLRKFAHLLSKVDEKVDNLLL